jgi:putative DNA primase/helicase
VYSSGPRTCANINAIWGGCASCPNYEKVKSPILIKGDDHIATQDAGFRKVKILKDGTVTAGAPNYDDMVKYFNQLHDYTTIIDTRQVWIFDETHWIPMERVELEAFAETILQPKPSSTERKEFVAKVILYNLRTLDFFETDGMMNLQNGVLDVETGELMEHTSEYGFRYTIPFDYNPEAPCERFDTFMEEITLCDPDLTNLILEYIGYCLSGCPAYKGEKAMILLGDGSNGKSVLLDVIRFLAGKDAYASISMADIQNEQHRFQLVGKLFNVSEETPRRSLADSSMFKNLITGGEMTVKKVYQPPFSVNNHCKFIFAANDLPDSTDRTNGMFRRLLIVPFRAEFTGQQIDRKIRQKLQAEASGILNRVIEGYIRLSKNDYHFTQSQKAEESRANYTSEINSLGDWIKHNLKYDATVAGAFVADLYNEYKASMEMAGAEPRYIENYIEFARRIGPELRVDYAKLKTRKRKGGLSVTYVKHVVLNKTEDDDEEREF